MEHTYHFGEPRPHETKKGVAFYAYRDDPSSWTPCLVVEQVIIRNVGGKTSGVYFDVGDMYYDKFTEQFATHGIRDVISEILKTLIKTVIANVGAIPVNAEF